MSTEASVKFNLIDVKNSEQLDFDFSGSWDMTKKLLIIDTDGKLLQNPRSRNQEPIPRYYLHKFLRRVYKYYNIVLWSSDSLESLHAEMASLGIVNGDEYRISLCLDGQSLTNASVSPESVKLVKHPVVIWKLFPDTYSIKNTVIINGDGMTVDKYKSDDNLLRLSEYLEVIRDCRDFRTFNHAKWEETRRMYRESWRERYAADAREVIKSYKVKKLNPLRKGQKLLVLDIDETIYNRNHEPSRRPHLDEFLTRAYVNYDIAIWSARPMSSIELVLTWLGITEKEEYKIAFLVDREAMITVPVMKAWAKVKPLDVIWGIFPQFSAENTIMIDDQSINFTMNKSSGLLIKAFPGAGEDPGEDRELLKIIDYLYLISWTKDFRRLNHKNWETD